MARNVRRASAVLLFSGLTLAVVSQQAAAAAQAAPDRAQQLFRLSGMDRQLGSLAATIELQIANEAGIPDSMRPTLARAARDAYAPESLRGVALSHLRPKLATGPLDAVMKWLSSERGRRITQLEETASTPEAQAKLAAFAATLQSSPPKPERVALIQRLDAATRSTDLVTDVALRIAAAVAHGLLAAQPVSTPTPDLDAILEAQRPQIRAGMQSSVLVTYLFTYRELSDADLGAYVAFMESGPGQWYNDATSSAFVASLDYAASRLSANLATAGRPQAPANAR